MRLWHLRNTNLDLLFLVQIEAPRQGAEKCPETPKITNFTGKSPNFGKIPLKLVKWRVSIAIMLIPEKRSKMAIET